MDSRKRKSVFFFAAERIITMLLGISYVHTTSTKDWTTSLSLPFSLFLSEYIFYISFHQLASREYIAYGQSRLRRKRIFRQAKRMDHLDELPSWETQNQNKLLGIFGNWIPILLIHNQHSPGIGQPRGTRP